MQQETTQLWCASTLLHWSAATLFYLYYRAYCKWNIGCQDASGTLVLAILWLYCMKQESMFFFVRSCAYFLQPCGQPVVAAVGGTTGRLITESEETSHPPPLFLPGPKWSETCCNTHTQLDVLQGNKAYKCFGALTHTHTHNYRRVNEKNVF